MHGHQNRGCWRGRSPGSGSEGRPERFMEACLLLLLRERTSHGYELITRLEEYGFSSGSIDPGAIYRALRRLEMDGAVESEWETSEAGPAKRLYKVTPDGQELLDAWASALQKTRGNIEKFLRDYNKG